MMKESINEIEKAMEELKQNSPWDDDTKVSDDFLDPLFRKFFKKVGDYNLMAKSNFHELARFVPKEIIDPEVKEKLDAIVEVAESAKPRE